MKTRWLPLFTGLALLAFAEPARSATITWTNISGGNWSATNNWSPQREPTNGDLVLITTPGTYTVTQDIGSASQSLIPTVTLGAGGGGAGVQSLTMSGLNFSFTNMLVTTGGVFAASSSAIGDYDTTNTTTMTVAGGVLNSMANTFYVTTLIVTNGGVVNSTNTSLPAVTLANGVINSDSDTVEGYYNGVVVDYPVFAVANGGVLNEAAMAIPVRSSLNVSSGGIVNVLDSSYYSALLGSVTNSGTINITNGGILLGYGDDSTLTGAIVNQAGGTINLRGAAFISSSGGFGTIDTTYFANHGNLTESAGAGSTIAVAYFDNSQGTISNLSGALTLENLATLTGTYYAAAGTFIELATGTNALTPGTPLVLAGSGQILFLYGTLLLPSNTVPNLILLGTTLELGPAFQGGAITNLTLNGISLSNTLPITGTFAATNSTLEGSFMISNHGVFAGSNTYVYGPVTVANGGIFDLNVGYAVDGLTVSNGGVANLSGAVSVYQVTVAAGGVANIAGSLGVYGPVTNSGTVNISNCAVSVNYYPIRGSLGGIFNQPGGLMEFTGGGSSVFYNYGPEYFVNHGNVAQNAPGGTNTIHILGFDTSQGTVTNLAGTLVLGIFETNLAGTFDAAAGATIQFVGGTATNLLTPGTPLVMAGGGLCEFTSGYLYLPTTLPPSLTLCGPAVVELGPGFQGGAITNLTLSGATLTNTLTVKGTFTATNQSTIYGSFTVANGGVFNLGGTVNGAVTVANGGLMTVAGGGAINSSGSLTLANGGTLNISAPGLDLYGPMTNAGTLNMTNTGMFLEGGSINQAGGLIDIWDNTGIGGYGSVIEGGYLLNQGRIVQSSGYGFAGLLSSTTNSGTIISQTGTILFGGVMWQLAPGSLNAVLNSATNYGSFGIYDGPGNLNGAFNVTLNNGYIPTNGTTFSLFSSASNTGTFSSLGLPAAVSWQASYGTTNFTLVAGNAKPQFGKYTRLGTNLIFSGLGGSPGSNYVVLTSTNPMLPLTSWTALTTNVFNSAGDFAFTNAINPGKPRQFFMFKTP